MQLATAWPGLPSDLCFLLLEFMIGTRWVKTNREDTRAMVALATELRNKTADLANSIQDLLPDAGPADAHPFNVLQGVYQFLPSLETVCNLLVADLKYITDTVLRKCQDMPMYIRYFMRTGLWDEALGPALQLVVAMRQWHVSGPPLNLVTEEEMQLISRLFEDALELGRLAPKPHTDCQ